MRHFHVLVTGLTTGNFYLPTNLTCIGVADRASWSWARLDDNSDILNKAELVSLTTIKLCTRGTKEINLSNFSDFPYLSSLCVYDMASLVKGSLKDICKVDENGNLINPERFTQFCCYGFSGNSYSLKFGKNFLDKVGEFKNLEILDLHYNKNITELPDDFNELSNLKELYLSNTSISSLKNIDNLENLNKLDLAGVTSLTENGFYKKSDGSTENFSNMEIFASLFNKNLKYLYLSGTGITDFSLIKDLGWTGKSGF